MPTLLATHVTTGAHLRQFVLDLLRERGLSPPTPGAAPALDDYLSSLWRVAQGYRVRPFEYSFIAEILEKAFEAPPMLYDWHRELQLPYRKQDDHLAPYQSPEYYAEADTYSFFERRIKRQILEIKFIKRQPSVSPWGQHSIDGHTTHWENLYVEGFLERGTIYLEENTEVETEPSWRDFSSILMDGQFTE